MHTTVNSPTQVVPLPVYPGLQVQLKLPAPPTTSEQVAFLWQVSTPSSHSLISVGGEMTVCDFVVFVLTCSRKLTDIC